jgi:hypothetical protein
MGQNRYTLSQGDTEKQDVVIATDATSFTGEVRLIVKDTLPKSEVLKLIDMIRDVVLTSNYPF